MPRMRAQASPSNLLYLKQIARARHPTLCWVMRIGAFAFAEHTKLSLASRKTVAFARMSGGNGARLQAAFYAACLKRSLPPRCHSEPPRMRRVEESTKAAAKRLLCNHARVPTHKLYCNTARSFDFVPRYARHFAQDDRVAERCRFKLITPAAVRRRGGVFAKLYSILISERLPRLTVTCEAVRGKFSRAVVRILAYQTARHIVGTTYQYPG